MMKVIVFLERQGKKFYVYGMFEHPNWERILIFDRGFNTREGALEAIMRWKETTTNEVYVDLHSTPDLYKRREKVIIYFKRDDDKWYVKFLFKIGVWHYVFLSEKRFSSQEALGYAKNWAARNKAPYEIFISEGVLLLE